MKNRVLVIALVVAMAAALIGGGTMAWFNDQDSAEPVAFQAGTLLIDIQDEGVTTTGINLENLNPGDVFEYTFDVANVGTKNLIFTGLLCYKDTLGNALNDFPEGKDYGTHPLSEVLELEVSVGSNTFYTGTLADYNNSTNLLGAYPGGGLPQFENPPIVFGEAQLNYGASYPYTVKITFPGEDADNKYQGSRLDAAFVVLARQASYADDSQYPEFICPLAAELEKAIDSGQNDYNKAKNRPHINHSVDGKKLTIEFVNPTNFAFSWDYKVDGKPEGTDDDWTGQIIGEGELAGQDFGQRYGKVTIIGQGTKTMTFTAMDEVRIRLARGAEQNWYFDWIVFEAK